MKATPTDPCYSITAGLFPMPSIERSTEKTISKTVRDSDGWWPTLTEREILILGRGSAGRTGPLALGATAWGPHRNSF